MHLNSLAAARPILRELWAKGLQIGSVHTLGALHRGHGELIKRSSRENDETIVTVYPNRIQLFPGHRYKYDLSEDVAYAFECGASMVISSQDEEMFSKSYCTFLDQGSLHKQLNSSIFDFAARGQVTGSIRWISFTRPTRSYFGMKDIEQAILVGRAVDDLLIDCDINYVPCVRFTNGVPISSRLIGLEANRLGELGWVYCCLVGAREMVARGERDSKVIVDFLISELNKRLQTFKIKYVAVVSASDLLPMDIISLPFILHVCVSDGALFHFDGQWIRSEAELKDGPNVIWLTSLDVK